jgi:glycosyltransferase involved in cell wall biosynthesis
MPIDFGIHGLDYTRELCRAIERYTASSVSRDSRAYVYRSMQLRYAVERRLYIQCINSEALFHHYLARENFVSAWALPALNPVESDIAFFLCNQRALDEHPPLRIGRWLLRKARCVYGWLRRWRLRAPLARIPVQRREILIHVVNAKFANYLAPLTLELDLGSFAYLATRDSGLGELLAQRGFPVLGVPTDACLRHHVFCSYALSDFLQLMQDADATLGALSVLHPRCVLVVEGNAPLDVITAEASRLLGIPCYCMQQGWSPYVHSGFRNMSYSEMFVWGPRFAELLRPYNPGQVFRVTGSHALKNPAALSARDSVTTLGFFLQAPCALLGVQAYEDFVDLIVSVAQAYPRVRVIVREHPGYPLPDESRQKLQGCPNVHFSIPAVEPLAEVIAASDLVVSIFSTVLLEAMAMNVVPLICSIGAMRHYEPAIAAAGAAIEVHSVADARRAIDQVIAEPARLASIRESMSEISAEFFSPENAAKTIAARLSSAGSEKRAEEHSNDSGSIAG